METCLNPITVRYTSTRILNVDWRTGVTVGDYPQTEQGMHDARYERERLNREHREGE